MYGVFRYSMQSTVAIILNGFCFSNNQTIFKMNMIRSDSHNAVDFLIIGYCSKDRESAFRTDDMIL